MACSNKASGHFSLEFAMGDFFIGWFEALTSVIVVLLGLGL
jgi:hypothetical protein